MGTKFLYGVFVTEKSHLIGTRKQVLKRFANNLASKACGDRLPEEVVALVAWALYDSTIEPLESKWNSESDFDYDDPSLRHKPSNQPALESLDEKLVRTPHLIRAEPC